MAQGSAGYLLEVDMGRGGAAIFFFYTEYMRVDEWLICSKELRSKKKKQPAQVTNIVFKQAYSLNLFL